MNGNYPTKEQILNNEIIFRKKTIDTIIKWKEKYFNDNKWKETDKNQALIELLTVLGLIYNKPVNIEMDTNFIFAYDPEVQTIYLNSSKPSIISSLHEFAHHIKGNNEYEACGWSVWLFKKTFPESYKKLKWNGHLLTK